MTFFGTLSVWFLTWERSSTDVFLAFSKAKPKKRYGMLWEKSKKTDLGFPSQLYLGWEQQELPSPGRAFLSWPVPYKHVREEGWGPPPVLVSCLYQTANTAKLRCRLSGFSLRAKHLLPSCFTAVSSLRPPKEQLRVHLTEENFLLWIFLWGSLLLFQIYSVPHLLLFIWN